MVIGLYLGITCTWWHKLSQILGFSTLHIFMTPTESNPGWKHILPDCRSTNEYLTSRYPYSLYEGHVQKLLKVDLYLFCPSWIYVQRIAAFFSLWLYSFSKKLFDQIFSFKILERAKIEKNSKISPCFYTLFRQVVRI